MVKSIENDSIRIGSAPDLIDNIGWGDDNFVGRFKLPLFSVLPKLITIEDLENDRNLICFIIKRDFYRYNHVMEKGFSLSLVERINNVWSEFYEKSTRK